MPLVQCKRMSRGIGKNILFFGCHFFGFNLSHFWFFIIYVLPDDKQVHRFILSRRL